MKLSYEMVFRPIALSVALLIAIFLFIGDNMGGLIMYLSGLGLGGLISQIVVYITKLNDKNEFTGDNNLS